MFFFKLRFFRKPIRNYFLVAADLVDELKQKLNQEIKIYEIFDSDLFKDVYYRSPITPDLALPFLKGRHVNVSMGTGLVHTSYAHGFDDYKVNFILKL